MKRIIALIVTMMALGATIPASTASASTQHTAGPAAWWDCPEGYFCAWFYSNGEDEGNDGEPDFYGRSGAPDLDQFGLNDHVDSVWNRTGEVWCAYPDDNYTDINGRSKAPNSWPIGNWRGNTAQYGMEDVISSLSRGACRA